jgi:hypothetical protein
MEAGTQAPPDTGASTNGTHPEGVGEDEAQARAAQVIGLAELGQLSFDVGGKKPDTSKVKLAGRSIELPKGQLKKGSEVTIQCRVRVSGVHFDDKIDSTTETVTGCTRKQVCRIVGDVHVIPDAE